MVSYVAQHDLGVTIERVTPAAATWRLRGDAGRPELLYAVFRRHEFFLTDRMDPLKTHAAITTVLYAVAAD